MQSKDRDGIDNQGVNRYKLETTELITLFAYLLKIVARIKF